MPPSVTHSPIVHVTLNVSIKEPAPARSASPETRVSPRRGAQPRLYDSAGSTIRDNYRQCQRL